MVNKMNDKYNASHAPDPTLYAVIQRESTQSINQEFEYTLRILKRYLSAHGFELIGRIPMRHVKSGREFR